ncbi:hypothetical protein [Hallella sp.]|uniref:hypothetical protein n=1 Tax=Hallella sp. TaxID=2980186 RepID=UPI00307C5768
MQSYELFAERNRVLAVFFKELRIKPKQVIKFQFLLVFVPSRLQRVRPKPWRAMAKREGKQKCGPCNHPKRKTSHIPKKKMGLLLAHSLGKVYLWHVIRQKKCVKRGLFVGKSVSHG